MTKKKNYAVQDVIYEYMIALKRIDKLNKELTDAKNKILSETVKCESVVAEFEKEKNDFVEFVKNQEICDIIRRNKYEDEIDETTFNFELYFSFLGKPLFKFVSNDLPMKFYDLEFNENELKELFIEKENAKIKDLDYEIERIYNKNTNKLAPEIEKIEEVLKINKLAHKEKKDLKNQVQKIKSEIENGFENRAKYAKLKLEIACNMDSNWQSTLLKLNNIKGKAQSILKNQNKVVEIQMAYNEVYANVVGDVENRCFNAKKIAKNIVTNFESTDENVADLKLIAHCSPIEEMKNNAIVFIEALKQNQTGKNVISKKETTKTK